MQPKMHTEADRQLRDIVARQIEWSPELESKDIGVSATDGTISLTGFVHNFFEKFAAERAAKAVYGVRAVANDIEVKPFSTRTDPEIARDITDGLRIRTYIPESRIKVTVRDGSVILDGTVDWEYQRHSAETCARDVAGVRHVTNSIVIKPGVVPSDVKVKIEDALRRNAVMDARSVNVSATNGTVTLSGHVHSWLEKEEAERAAWAAPGVTRVIDLLTVGM